jgi:archaemetzincin
MGMGRSVALVGLLFVLLAASPTPGPRYDYLLRVRASLAPLHRKLPAPKEGEWLDRFPEKGQTFERYVESKPVVRTSERGVLYTVRLGPSTGVHGRVSEQAAEFLGLYFSCPTRSLPALPLDLVPSAARRADPWGGEQLLTSYILQHVLKPRLPSDACAFIAFTEMDLWPGKGWNFVFGQATLRDRVAVFSTARFYDPAYGKSAYSKCLLRTCKVSSHECLHMFSMPHCTFYECNACGSNSLAEMDGRPIALCPECVAKLCWATDSDPAQRYRSLAAFARKHGLVQEALFWESSLKALPSAAR